METSTEGNMAAAITDLLRIPSAWLSLGSVLSESLTWKKNAANEVRLSNLQTYSGSVIYII